MQSTSSGGGELLVGQTISRYEIIQQIGRGGMGVVYKARDTHLDRLVALKVLPPERVTDPERLRRFVQEARAASSLNHPNIVRIYDVDSADGLPFITMEYLPGETLDRLIGRRGMPLKQVVDCAIQIADALGNAHAAGLVHRDIKPSNIMVTPDGAAKLLDFGLAKLVEPPESSGEFSTHTATHPPLTEEGRIVGTVAYMSPEQATGEKLDGRSDIFSFGAVMYEAVTGRRAFDAGTPASTIKAILASDPHAPAELTGGLPFELERAIQRCLRKDPQRRWQNMADLKVALLDVKSDLESGRISQVSTVAVRRRPPRWIALGSGIAAVIIAGAAVAWWMMRPAVPRPVFPIERLTFEGHVVMPPAISADGNLIAFSAEIDGRYNLFLQQHRARQPIRLTNHESNDWLPTFSPDGLKIVYRSERDGGGLYMIDTLGGTSGAELKVADGGAYPSFSPDGRTIAFLVTNVLDYSARMFVVSAGGGTPRPFNPRFVMRADGSIHFQPPLWSPDGANILFAGRPAGDDTSPSWRIAAVSGGEPIEVKDQPQWPEWSARFAVAWRGEYVYYVEGEPTNGSTIYRVRLLPRPWRMVGPPEKVASSGELLLGGSVSNTGQMVVTSMSTSQSLWSAPLTNRGSVSSPLQQMTADAFWKRRVSTTADGSRVAFGTYSHAALANVEARIRDVATGRESLIAGAGKYPFMDPILSLDGSRVAYSDAPADKIIGYVADTSSNAGRPICEGCRVVGLFNGRDAALVAVGTRLQRQPFDGSAAVPVMEAPAVRAIALSPDSELLAFTQPRAGGGGTLYLTDISRGPVPRTSWKVIAEDRNYLGAPAWSPDGKVLYYVSQRDGFPCVWRQPINGSRELDVPATVALHLHPGSALLYREIAIAIARERIFILKPDTDGDIWSVSLER